MDRVFQSLASNRYNWSSWPIKCLLPSKPDEAYGYVGRGAVRQVREDLSGALADYNQAVLIKPDLAGAYENRGVVKRLKGDLVGAAADHQKAIELDPKLLLPSKGVSQPPKTNEFSMFSKFKPVYHAPDAAGSKLLPGTNGSYLVPEAKAFK